MGVHTILAVQYSVDLQYSSQIVETGAFVLNFLQISYIHASHLCSHSDVLLSFPHVELSVFWSTEMTANPNQHLGGKNHTSVSRFVTRIAILITNRWNRSICLEFSPNFLHSRFTPFFSLKCAALLSQCWAAHISEHWNDCKPKPTLGREKSHKCFKICDEDCSLRPFLETEAWVACEKAWGNWEIETLK